MSESRSSVKLRTVKRKGEVHLGGKIESKDRQLAYLQRRFELLANVVEGMNADTASVEELDRLLSMIDDIEVKCKQFRKDWPE